MLIAVYENARNTTNDFMTFGNGTAGSAAVPTAANGGPWVIGEIIDYKVSHW